jgi:4-aminobutyrate aminotransferase-like enzyme
MLDRRRIRQLSERESAALDERTGGSAAMFRRARRVLAGGVASSFQAREPWPIYLTRGEGQRVWDVDGNEFFDFHNGFSSMLQGHAHPAIGAAISERYGYGTHFAAPTEDAIVVAEELSRRWNLTRWRFTNSGTESTMGAIRIARGLTSAASRSVQPSGSCIVVVATDAHLSSAQLSRVARRAGLGLARTGSVGHHHSGEIFLAFSTSARSPATEYGDDLDPLFSATVDATEEAVLNALWTATRTEGRQGRVVEALPHDAVLELLATHHRLEG